MTSELRPACCDEWRCRRSQPMRVARSELTGTWYVVTEYAERAGGAFESRQKHSPYPADASWLEDLYQDAQRMRRIDRGEMSRPFVDVELPADQPWKCANCKGKLPEKPDGPCPNCGHPS